MANRLTTIDPSSTFFGSFTIDLFSLGIVFPTLPFFFGRQTTYSVGRIASWGSGSSIGGYNLVEEGFVF